MLVLKIAPVLLLALAVAAEKKIELQDIEEDNLKSEKEKVHDKADPQDSLLPLEFLKNGLLRYFEAPTHTQQPQQPRYVQQYAVTEQPERQVQVQQQPQLSQPTPQPKPQYGPPTAQQAMVGYLSNVPMQIYLVPQYYNDQSEQVSAQAGVQYTAPAVTRVAYPSMPEALQTQANYVEVPAYVAPTAKTYVQQSYSPPVAYLSYTSQPTAQTHTTATVAYQPVQVQYPTAIVAPPVSKGYYQNVQYTDTNTIDDAPENEDEGQKQYVAQTEAPYTKTQDYTRYYNSRHPVREEYKHSSVPELPAPNPLLLKAPSPHLSHIPKALPMYRPLNKPVYGGSSFIPNYTQRPHEAFGFPFKRRPTSLLDSYIPSSLQVEYLKRGYTKDPLVIYDALASGRLHHIHPSVAPRHFERGFLPNQMYHTAGGGVTYGHYKRSPPKIDKAN